jgi:hypothetical protein
VTAQKHQELLTQFETGEDRNPEHYRWRTFCDFIERNERLSEDIIRRLYRPGESDPDSAMGDSMMAKIVWRSDCPEDVLNGSRYIPKASGEDRAKA